MDDLGDFDFNKNSEKKISDGVIKSTRKKRRLIRLYSFAAAFMLVGVGFYISGVNERVYSQRINDAVYNRAFSELTSQVCSAETSLEKMMYVTDITEMISLSADLFRQVGFAKSFLGQLPIQDTDLMNLQQFLSQSGDYVYSLIKKTLNGEEVAQVDKDNIKMLYQYSSKLALKLATVQDIVSRSNKNGTLTQILAVTDISETVALESMPSLGGMGEVEKLFSDYPRLIYDGPFSSSINEAPYRYIENETDIDKEQALSISAKILNKPHDDISYESSTKSNLATFNFRSGDKYIQITKKGGVLLGILSGRKIRDQIISDEEALYNASAFLESLGHMNMQYTYYLVDNGVLIANFACMENGVIIYPDLIKVGVATDNGEIVFYESTGFIKNHTEREMPKNIITQDAARSSLSNQLEILSCDMALIPTDSGREIFCYEFKCKNTDGKEYISYINAVTGREEDILIIIDTGRGKLTM